MTEQSNVVSPWGYLVGEPKVNADLVKCLEDLLELAKAGEIVGMAGAIGYKDGLASYRISGILTGYSLVGAMTVARSRVAAIVDGTD